MGRHARQKRRVAPYGAVDLHRLRAGIQHRPRLFRRPDSARANHRHLAQCLHGKGEPRPEGLCLGSVWASYVHLPFWAKPELAWRFVERCRPS